MEATVYNKEGKEVSKVTLPEALFGLKWNADLVHQVVTAMEGNARGPVAHTKDRSEVSGGGKKPWRQKGTGRARHGSIRSPIWRSGGVAHGPRSDRDYTRKVNKKMRTKALFTVLSRKWRDGEVIFIEDMMLSAPKTKLAATTVQNLAKGSGADKLAWKRGNRLLLSIPEQEASVTRSFQNLKSVLVRPAAELNPVDALRYRYVVIADPEKSLATLLKRTK